MNVGRYKIKCNVHVFLDCFWRISFFFHSGIEFLLSSVDLTGTKGLLGGYSDLKYCEKEHHNSIQTVHLILYFFACLFSSRARFHAGILDLFESSVDLLYKNIAMQNKLLKLSS